MKEIKRIIFLSNFFNHHQQAFSDAMYARLGEGYTFVETQPMPQERKGMGWSIQEIPPYVVPSAQLKKMQVGYEEIIYQADVVIFGSAPYELVKRRIRENKLTFRYSERPLKKGLEIWRYPDRFIRWQWMYPQNKHIYLLCASAYAARDYRKFFLFRNRAYKWGYFPETKWYNDIDALLAGKKKNSLIWVARYLPLKHPERAVEIAKRLKHDGYDFELKMIGNGQLLEDIRMVVQQEGLEDVIQILGAIPHEEVRHHMELAKIHLFTSDRNEGWGAVLNESMNSACVPIADRDIGSAPFLIREGCNGYLYSTIDELYEKVRYLMEHDEECSVIAKRAYMTITEEWNAEIAAERFLLLSESILHGKKYEKYDGCCSIERNY